MNHFGRKSATQPVPPIGYYNKVLWDIPRVKHGGCLVVSLKPCHQAPAPIASLSEYFSFLGGNLLAGYFA